MSNKRKISEIPHKIEKDSKKIHVPNNPSPKIASTLSEKDIGKLRQELKTLEEEFNSIFPVIVEWWAWDWTQSINVLGLKNGELVLIKKFTWKYNDDVYGDYYKWKEGKDKKLFELKERMKKLRKEIKKIEKSE